MGHSPSRMLEREQKVVRRVDTESSSDFSEVRSTQVSHPPAGTVLPSDRVVGGSPAKGGRGKVKERSCNDDEGGGDGDRRTTMTTA